MGKEPYYVGIAEFGIEQLSTAIEMISDSPAMYTIICANHDRPSHCQELLDQVLEIGLTESGNLPVVEMVTTLTAQGYAVCTWEVRVKNRNYSVFIRQLSYNNVERRNSMSLRGVSFEIRMNRDVSCSTY